MHSPCKNKIMAVAEHKLRMCVVCAYEVAEKPIQNKSSFNNERASVSHKLCRRISVNGGKCSW